MFNPLQTVLVLVDPRVWIEFGEELAKASPFLIPIYAAALQWICQDHCHSDRTVIAHQLMALDLTMMAFAVYSLVMPDRPQRV